MTDDETWVDADHANTLNAFDVGDTRTTHAVVEQASTLQGGSKGSRGHRNDAEGAAGGHLVPVAIPLQDGRSIAKNQNGLGIGVEGDPAYTLDRTGAQSVAQAFTQNQREEVRDLGEQSGALTGQGTHQQTYLREQMTVRRLTPVECERLMGWPDGWTAPEGVKASDSKRYAACGDGIVAPVAFWIADRIRMIEEEGAS